MGSFAGPWFHPTRWPEDLELAGTRFALIGAGATGFQIGPAIAGQVSRLTIFQRTAQWIIPNPLYHAPVPPGDRWALRHLPFYGRWYRLIMSLPGIAAGTHPYRIDPEHHDPTGRSVNPGNAKRADALVAWMRSIVGDRADLLPKVVPDYPAIGKRTLQDDGTWLRCLMRPDTELVRTAIERIGRRHRGRPPLRGGRHLLRDRVPAQRLPGVDGRDRPGRDIAARAMGRGANRLPGLS